MYGHFKTDLAGIVVEALRPVQEKYEKLMTDKGELERIIAANRERAIARAEGTLRSVYDKLGLVPAKR